MDSLENILGEVDMERGYQLLTIRERNIISLYYLVGYKDEEIAAHYGVTRQNIFKIRKNGIVKLKKKKIF
jgi:RNA polymerase sigma factor for flagellar operon FliA